MSLTLLAVVVLSALCAAEAIVAATPRGDVTPADGVMAYWAAGRDRDASTPRSVRASDARNLDQLAEAGDDWKSSGGMPAFLSQADDRGQDNPRITDASSRGFCFHACQLSLHRLNLPPPLA